MGQFLRPLAGCDQFVSGEVFHVPVDLSYVPLRGVILIGADASSTSGRLILRPLAGCDGKNEQK